MQQNKLLEAIILITMYYLFCVMISRFSKTKQNWHIKSYVLAVLFFYNQIRQNLINLLNSIYGLFNTNNIQNTSSILSKQKTQNQGFLATIIGNNMYLELVCLGIYALIAYILYFFFVRKGSK